jgi:hypothetical protein
MDTHKQKQSKIHVVDVKFLRSTVRKTRRDRIINKILREKVGI